jgi:MFS family permease
VLEQRDRTDVDHPFEEPAPDDPRWLSDEGTVTTEREVPESAERVTTRRRFTGGQLLILLAGVAALVLGVGAIALAGLAGSITEPVVKVFGFSHTPLLGVIEVGVGVVLILAALLPGGRWIAGLVGGGAIAGGALILAEYEWTQTELAAARRFGWVAIGIGAAAYLGAMVAPKKRVVATP